MKTEGYNIAEVPPSQGYTPEELERIAGAIQFAELKVGNLEESLPLSFEPLKEAEAESLALIGRTSDVIRKLKLAILPLTLTAVGFFAEPAFAGAKRVTSLEQPAEKLMEYGSPEYKADLDLLRAKLREAGFNDPVQIHTNLGYQQFWGVMRANPDLKAKIWNAIENKNYELREEQKSKEESENVFTPQEDWDSILEKIDYPSILQKAAYEFGIEPYKRLGYQRYELFNADVIKASENMNKRTEALGQKDLAYLPITPGLLAAVSLQEGLAKTIEGAYDPYEDLDTFHDIGMDEIIVELPLLQKEGLLPPDFLKQNGVDPLSEIFGTKKADTLFLKNEAGMEVQSLHLNIRTALEGLAAILVNKRHSLVEAVGRARWDSFNTDEQNWLTYAAFQWGQGNVITMLSKNVLPIDGKNIHISNYTRYINGKPSGNVRSITEFIHRNHGRETRPASLGDFHNMASQVAVSAKVADKFFASQQRANP